MSLARDNLLAMLAESGDVPLRARDKLLVGRHVSRNAARRERFTCAFEEYSIDTALSRVLLATCRALLGVTSADITHEALSHCVLVLQDVGEVGDPLPWLDRVVLTRQNERFAELLVFCRMVLKQLAPTARAGRASTFSLLFDMDRVFEGFIAGFLRRRVLVDLPDTRIFPQARTRREFLLRGDEGHGALALKPDLLVEAAGARLVIDTKWKRLGLLDKHGQPEGAEVRVRFVDLHRNLRHTAAREALAAELRFLLEDNLVAA